MTPWSVPRTRNKSERASAPPTKRPTADAVERPPDAQQVRAQNGALSPMIYSTFTMLLKRIALFIQIWYV